MNKTFIIFYFLVLNLYSVNLLGTAKGILSQVLYELAALHPQEVCKLQKDRSAINALAMALRHEPLPTLCPKELEPFLRNPEINSLLEAVLRCNN